MGYGFGRINDLVDDCHEIARDHGFWDDRDPSNPLHILAALMLVTTEVAEAAEAVRQPKFGNLEEELADIVIRVFDLAGVLQFNLEQAIVDKMEKNRD